MRLRRISALAAVAGLAVTAVVAAQATAAKGAKCSNANPLVIGASFAMSGPGAGLGRLDQQGASMAFRDVNAAGGVLGRCIKEDLQDDGGDPTKAAQVVRLLLDQDNVKFVVGPFFSSAANIELPVMNQAKVININESSSPFAGDPTKYPYTFQRESNTTLQAQTFVPFLKANHWTNVGILAVNTAFGTAFVSAMQDLAKQNGITITKVVFVNSGTPDVTPLMSELRNSSPQALITAISADPDQTAMLKARIQLGWHIPALGFSSMANPGTVNNFQKSQLDRAYVGQVYRTLTYRSAKAGHGKPTDPRARAFVTSFAKWIHAHNIKESINQASGGYDSVRILAWAINGAKSTDPDVVKRYIETHPYVGVRGKYIWSSTNHEGVNLPMLGFGLANSLNNYGLLQLAPGQ